MFSNYTTQLVFLPCVQYVAVHCDNFKFNTVLSHCDLAYSFDRFRDYSDQLGLEPRTSNEGCPGRCSIQLELKTRDFRLRPYCAATVARWGDTSVVKEMRRKHPRWRILVCGDKGLSPVRLGVGLHRLSPSTRRCALAIFTDDVL